MAGLLVESQLADFLRAETAKAMAWGQWDCGLRIADWLVERLGVPDPAAHLRGRYTDQQSCEALIGSPYPIVIARLIRGAGLKATINPQAGDVGIIRSNGTMVGAIRTAGGWTFPTAKGILRLHPDQTRCALAWRVG